MHHKYATRAIVLARSPLGEANTLLTLLTHDLGLVRARAQGLRHPKAKLAHALTTFAESDLVFVRGAEGWRVTGAIAGQDWFAHIPCEERTRAARVVALILELVSGESADARLFEALRAFFEALVVATPEARDAAEILAALSILAALGLDAGAIPAGTDAFATVALDRTAFVSRINRGIAAAGL